MSNKMEIEEMYGPQNISSSLKPVIFNYFGRVDEIKSNSRPFAFTFRGINLIKP